MTRGVCLERELSKSWSHSTAMLSDHALWVSNVYSISSMSTQIIEARPFHHGQGAKPNEGMPLLHPFSAPPLQNDHNAGM